MMVGRQVLFRVERTQADPGEVVLTVKDLNALDNKDLPALRDISFSVREGEILGIAGVEGNGQTELAEVVSALRRVESGTIAVDGQPVANGSVRVVTDMGVGHIPEDRIGVGMVASAAVKDNMAIARVASWRGRRPAERPGSW